MESKNYRLGLDLGTNSIGWAIYSLGKKNEAENLIDLGVRIFSDGRNPKNGEPLSVERRISRAQRKTIYRRKLRRRETFRILQQQNLFPKTKEEAAKLKALNPYELRAKALDKKLKAVELARVLFNLSVRRGFKSNRKDKNQNAEKNENSKSEKISQGEMQENLQSAIKNANCKTLGEFLWKTKSQNGGLRFVPGRMNYYPIRKMYEEEFDAIKNAQEKFFANVDWKKIKEAIFFQRPLKKPERGFCQYDATKKRTLKAMPCSEKLRVLQEVRNLKFCLENKKNFSLSKEQEKIVLALLYEKKSVKFSTIKKALGLSENCIFNFEGANRTELKGCPTAVEMQSEKRFGKLWNSLSLEKQDDIVEKIFDAENDDEIFEMLCEFDLNDEQKNSIAKLDLPLGCASLCREVSEKIVQKMESAKMQIAFSEAVEMLGYKYADQTVEKFDVLPYYGKVLSSSTVGGDDSKPENLPEEKYGKISNPTVHVALNQTRTVVNAIICKYGKPRQIVVELSRELKQSRQAKDDFIKRQKQNEKQNKILNKIISSDFRIKFPSRDDRLKFRLWQELGEESFSRRCIYCGKTISASKVFTSEIEIEHILPFARTLLDSESNKTVSHKSCNAIKGERSPFEAFGTNPSGYNWSEILLRANALKNPGKKRCFSETAMENFEKENAFISRQLTDNAYLSKAAKKYLSCLVEKPSDIWTVSGGMTKLLRDKWQIDSVLKRKISQTEIAHFGLKDDEIGTYKKNRYDHRHHALDAAVIALIDKSMVQEISRLNKISQKNKIQVPPSPVSAEFVEKVKNIVPSHKPDHGTQGKLSKETLLGKINHNGKEIFVSRSPVASLTEKNVSQIVDLLIQKKFSDFIELHKGQKFEEIAKEFSKETGIKKVRCKNKNQNVISFPPNKKTAIYRYYEVDSYCGAVIWKIPPKGEGEKPSYKAQFVRYDELDSKGNLKESGRPSYILPNATKLKNGDKNNMIYKGDYLEFSDGKNWYKCIIAGLNASHDCFDIRPIYATDFCHNWIISTAENMLDGCPLWFTKENIPKSHQNFISVNVLFGEKNARFITVNPIGRVFRKTQ